MIAAVGLMAFGGYLAYENGLVPVPLVSDAPLYVAAAPDPGEDQAVLEALVPASPALDTFLVNQSDLTLLARTGKGALAGQLLSSLQRSRNGKRWRLTFRPVRLQDGGALDAARVEAALGPEMAAAGAAVREVAPAALDLRFRGRRMDVPDLLLRWRIPGTGPFIRHGLALTRFDGFAQGRAGIAGLRVSTDPALLQSHAWAEGILAGRWAWAAYPGGVDPDDMARVRLAPYDEVHLTDGSVWFVSQKLRRFWPDRVPWPETRLFGTWRGKMNLSRVGALD
jgi:hypothetical protein